MAKADWQLGYGERVAVRGWQCEGRVNRGVMGRERERWYNNEQRKERKERVVKKLGNEKIGKTLCRKNKNSMGNI